MKLKHLATVFAACLTSTVAGTALAADIDLNTLKHRVDDTNAPVVYFTTDISPAGLMKAFEALGRTPTGKVAAYSPK